MRKRFNAVEKQLLSDTMTAVNSAENPMASHRYIEYRNVSTWGYLAKLKSGVILTDDFGWQYVEATNLSVTKGGMRFETNLRLQSGFIRPFDSDKTYR